MKLIFTIIILMLIQVNSCEVNSIICLINSPHEIDFFEQWTTLTCSGCETWEEYVNECAKHQIVFGSGFSLMIIVIFFCICIVGATE